MHCIGELKEETGRCCFQVMDGTVKRRTEVCKSVDEEF